MADRRDVRPIEIAGFREFSRGLRKMDAELPKMLRLAANEAAQLVVAEAQRNIPRRTGAAAKSIKAASTRTAARVQAGSKKVPYFGFLEFGGKVGPNKSVRRPFIREGRYLWPAIIRRREEIAEQLERGIRDVATAAGLDVD